MLKTLIEEYRYYFRIKPEVTNKVVAIHIIIFLALNFVAAVLLGVLATIND